MQKVLRKNRATPIYIYSFKSFLNHLSLDFDCMFSLSLGRKITKVCLDSKQLILHSHLILQDEKESILRYYHFLGAGVIMAITKFKEVKVLKLRCNIF